MLRIEQTYIDIFILLVHLIVDFLQGAEEGIERVKEIEETPETEAPMRRGLRTRADNSQNSRGHYASHVTSFKYTTYLASFDYVLCLASCNCIPRTKYVRGILWFSRHPQTLHRSHDNLKNPYRIASIFYM